MCGSASERTRAISWGEMVIEDCPGNPAVTPRAATSLRLLASRRPGRKRANRRSPRLGLRCYCTGTRALSDACVSTRAETCLTRPALLEEPCDGGSQLRYTGAGARRGHEQVRVRRGMLGERRLGRGDERREVGSLGLVGFGQHNLVVDRGLVQGVEHVGVDRLEAVAGVDQEVGAREIGASQEKGMDQRGPSLDLRLRGGRITVTRHVDERELRRPGEKDQLLRAARRMRGARERAPPGERVDQARLADIGAAGNGNLDAAHDGAPLTPGSLFFLVKRFFKAPHVRLRLSNSSILAPCLCMMKLCCATES